MRGASPSCIGTEGSSESATAVRPYFSTAARASAPTAPGITNDPAGNSTPFAVKLFSATFIATLFS